MRNANIAKMRPLAAPRGGIRLFKEDDAAIIELASLINEVDIKIDILDVLRECVATGVPIVRKRWLPIINAASPKE